jgi:hypothetical protein
MSGVLAAEEKKPQHMIALARANKVRLERAHLKREITAGRLEVTDVVRTVPESMETITLAELLTAQRRWGRTRARKFLLGIALSENKRLGTLTPRQRGLLSVELTRGKDDPGPIIV